MAITNWCPENRQFDEQFARPIRFLAKKMPDWWRIEADPFNPDTGNRIPTHALKRPTVARLWFGQPWRHCSLTANIQDSPTSPAATRGAAKQKSS